MQIILECELAVLAETRKCKKVITWTGDFGIDQYVSWCFPPEELCLDVTGPNLKSSTNHRQMK